MGNSRIDRELRDRTHIERIASMAINGNRLFGAATTFDYEVGGAYSDQFDPLTMTTTFRESPVTFAPNVSSSSIDPNNIQANPQNDDINGYNFQQQIRATNFASDRDIVGALNLRRPLRETPGATSFLKFGVKVSDKRKGRDRNESTYSPASTIRMSDALETGFDGLPPYLGGRYDLRPYLSQSLSSNIPNLAPMTVALNHQRDAENFGGTEWTTGAYAMAEIYAGSKMYVLPGIRYEYTAADFVGRNVRFAPSGAWLGTDPLEVSTRYGVPLPAVHVRYAATPNTNVRVAVVLAPYWIEGSSGTSHGSPYVFDTRVPLLMMGKGIAPGEYLGAASPTDVAPTLAFLAGVTLPRAQGRVLGEALSRSVPVTRTTN